jgi:hypothetical protein
MTHFEKKRPQSANQKTLEFSARKHTYMEVAYMKMVDGAITLSSTFTPIHPPPNQRGQQQPRGGQYWGDRGRGRRGEV